MNNLLLFAKTPLPGKVKTRLESDTTLSASEVLELYSAFLKDTLTAAILSDSKTVFVACFPASSQREMEQFIEKSGFCSELKKKRVIVIPQQGPSFEKRITAAANKVLSFSGLLVIIGSDAPTLRPGLLNKAFKMLHRDEQTLVLGPSSEGGVYLIGTNSKEQIDFTGIFDTGSEIENLADYAALKKKNLRLLEPLTDIDVQADLLTVKGYLYALKSVKEKDMYFPHHTFNAMEQTGLAVQRNDGNTRNKKLVRESID